MPRYAMVIDLQRCVGCSSCSISCRNENNVPEGMYWSHKITETSGTFPNVRFHYIPTLCNHCDNAPCARGCPTRAMHKLENGITMHDPKKCIGCRYCSRPIPGAERDDLYLICEDCMRHPPVWNAGKAVFLYESAGRRIVLGLKHAAPHGFLHRRPHFSEVKP